MRNWDWTIDDNQWMSDEELIEYLQNEPDSTEDAKIIMSALARIVVAMKKKWIDCGGFIWWWDESHWLTNADSYKHLGKMQDYCYRYSNYVINGIEDEEE